MSRHSELQSDSSVYVHSPFFENLFACIRQPSPAFCSRGGSPEPPKAIESIAATYPCNPWFSSLVRVNMRCPFVSQSSFFSLRYLCGLNCACAWRRPSAAALNSGLSCSAASNSGMLSLGFPDARRAHPRLAWAAALLGFKPQRFVKLINSLRNSAQPRQRQSKIVPNLRVFGCQL